MPANIPAASTLGIYFFSLFDKFKKLSIAINEKLKYDKRVWA